MACYVIGFVTDRNRRFVEDGMVEHPDAAAAGEGTYVYGINNSGRMAGWFDDGEKAHGFLLSR